MFGRVKAGVPAGGQFAKRSRGEASVSLGASTHENALFHNMTRGTMSLAQQRPLARTAVREAFEDGSVRRMLGWEGAHEAESIRAAAGQDRKLDAAVAALVEQERRTPGRIPSAALGYHISKQLLLAERNANKYGMAA